MFSNPIFQHQFRLQEKVYSIQKQDAFISIYHTRKKMQVVNVEGQGIGFTTKIQRHLYIMSVCVYTHGFVFQFSIYKWKKDLQRYFHLELILKEIAFFFFFRILIEKVGMKVLCTHSLKGIIIYSCNSASDQPSSTLPAIPFPPLHPLTPTKATI